MSNLKAAKEVGDDWVAGPYYDQAEPHMASQWEAIVWPMIHDCDFHTVLELAPGHGRNTARLLPLCQQLIAVDINDSNIEFLRERFGGSAGLRLERNNGVDLREVANASITFFYCFDAMVHFDSDVVRGYIREMRRVMQPGARGFCHYSNNDNNPQGTYKDHPGWRNFMSRTLFEHWLAKEGLTVVRSNYVKGVLQILPEDDGECDNLTVFELPAGAPPVGAFSSEILQSAPLEDDKRVTDLRSSVENLQQENLELRKTLEKFVERDDSLSRQLVELNSALDHAKIDQQGHDRTRTSEADLKKENEELRQTLKTYVERDRTLSEGLVQKTGALDLALMENEALRSKIPNLQR